MSQPGRAEGESLGAQREGRPVSTPGSQGRSVNAPVPPDGESPGAQRHGAPVDPPQRCGTAFRGTLIASALAAALGIGALGAATDGFHAFTSDTARALAVQQRPAALPAAWLTDQAGRRFDLLEELGSEGAGRPVWIVGFIYTRCVSLCSALTAQYRQLQQEIAATGWQGRVRVLLVSFDPEHDTPAVLQAHARRNGLAGSDALLAVPDTARDLQALLAAFGVRVLPLPDGEFAHNAAFHIVTPGPRLSRIVPIDEPARALDLAVTLARAHRGA